MDPRDIVPFSGIDGFGDPVPLVRIDRAGPPRLQIIDKEDNLVYMLEKEFEVPGQSGQSKIVAVSTKKDMIFDTAKEMAEQEYSKPIELGEWDFIILVFDNETGKFLDKVYIPKYRPKV